MSLATRCTHCGTIFKVVQDQLKVSEGWVRCGRCHEVFNALPALFDLEKDPPPPRPAHLSGATDNASPSQDARQPEVTEQPNVAAETPPPAPSPAAQAAPAEPAAQTPVQAPAPSPSAASVPAPPVAPGAEDLPAWLTRPPAQAPTPGAAFPFTPPQPSPLAGGAPAGVSIPLAAMPNVQPPPPPPAPSVAAPRSPLAEQGLMADEEVDPGFDSPPPSGWARTQPAEEAGDQRLSEDDLALDPPPIEATTDFELDTAIAVDDDTPLEAVLASMTGRPDAGAPSSDLQPPLAASAWASPPGRADAPGMAAPAATFAGPSANQPTPAEAALPEPEEAPQSPFQTPSQGATEDLSLRQLSPSPSPWLDEPPENVPSTEEEDALDSRYLLPSSSRVRRPVRRLEEGPEFADAEFPTDAFLDAEEDWASDFGPSDLNPEVGPGNAPAIAPDASDKASQPALTDGLRAAAVITANSDGSDANEAPPPTPASGEDAAALTSSQGDQPTFLKHARRKAFWRHPATRAALTLLALTLLATLALQLGHQFRDLIAAHHPASRPLLTQWCAIAGCELKPPLRIEDLQVESATLVRAASEGPDSYRLAVVVHNRAGIGLAWPHVDLTLTDQNGAVIARRVFSPDDAQWLDTADAKAETLNGQAAPQAASAPPAVPGHRSTTLQWRLLAPDIRPAGYTAELFYP